MGRKIVNTVIVCMVIWLAYSIGHWRANWSDFISCNDAQAEIDVYLECLQSAGKTGCRMQVDDFRRYHHLKRVIVGACEDAERDARL